MWCMVGEKWKAGRDYFENFLFGPIFEEARGPKSFHAEISWKIILGKTIKHTAKVVSLGGVRLSSLPQPNTLKVLRRCNKVAQ